MNLDAHRTDWSRERRGYREAFAVAGFVGLAFGTIMGLRVADTSASGMSVWLLVCCGCTLLLGAARHWPGFAQLAAPFVAGGIAVAVAIVLAVIGVFTWNA